MTWKQQLLEQKIKFLVCRIKEIRDHFLTSSFQWHLKGLVKRKGHPQRRGMMGDIAVVLFGGICWASEYSWSKGSADIKYYWSQHLQVPLCPNGVSHSGNLWREERAEKMCCEHNSIVRWKLGEHCGGIKVPETCLLLFFHQRTALWLFHSPLKNVCNKLYYHCIQYLDSKIIRGSWMSHLRMA